MLMFNVSVLLYYCLDLHLNNTILFCHYRFVEYTDCISAQWNHPYKFPGYDIKQCPHISELQDLKTGDTT